MATKANKKAASNDPALGIVNPHSQIKNQKKIEGAIALRKKLEQWKEEKKKIKELEQSKKTCRNLFTKHVKGVLSLPLQESRRINISRRHTTNLEPESKTTGQAQKTQLGSHVADALPPPLSNKSLARSRVSMPNCNPPANQQSNTKVGGARRGLGKIKAKDPGRDEDIAKENSQSALGIVTSTVNHISLIDEKTHVSDQPEQEVMKNLPAAITPSTDALITTPLSRNIHFSMRQAIASLASSASEKHEHDNQESSSFTNKHMSPLLSHRPAFPVSHADRVQTPASRVQPFLAVHPDEKRAMTNVQPSTESQVEGSTISETPGSKPPKPARHSISVQFRVSRNGNQNSVTSASCKTPNHVADSCKSYNQIEAGTIGTNTLSSQPHRSILKRKSCYFGNAEDLRPAKSAALVSQLRGKDVQSSEVKDEQSTAEVEDNCSDDKNSEQELHQEVTCLPSHVTFSVDVGVEDQQTNFRKTPAIRKDCKTQAGMRYKPNNDWLATKSATPSSLRHAGCFATHDCSSERVIPCQQIKPSITVAQLSKQEHAIVQEEKLKKNLLTHFEVLPSPVIRSSKGVAISSQTLQNMPMMDVPSSETVNVNSHDIDRPGMGTDDRNVNAAVGHILMDKEITLGNKDDYTSVVTETCHESSLEADLSKCLAVIESGSLCETTLQWLDTLLVTHPEVKHQVGWYRCRIAALKMLKDTDSILEVFEQAIINAVQPAGELAQLLTETVKDILSWKKSKNGRKSVTTPGTDASRKRRSSVRSNRNLEVQAENIFESTTVKYSVVEVTPFKKKMRASEAGEHLVPVITPVRRSARLSVARATPASEGRKRTAAHVEALYPNLEAVPQADKEHMLFQPNQALDPLLQEALILEDSDEADSVCKAVK